MLAARSHRVFRALGSLCNCRLASFLVLLAASLWLARDCLWLHNFLLILVVVVVAVVSALILILLLIPAAPQVQALKLSLGPLLLGLGLERQSVACPIGLRGGRSAAADGGGHDALHRVLAELLGLVMLRVVVTKEQSQACCSLAKQIDRFLQPISICTLHSQRAAERERKPRVLRDGPRDPLKGRSPRSQQLYRILQADGQKFLSDAVHSPVPSEQAAFLGLLEQIPEYVRV
mmetsp:Transcript_66765/g.139393  ORF Transcript_66765/g.139393 Transcript_66765/m.139393 type:complete len:233 (-) Transcript_66765:450-1148(-)